MTRKLVCGVGINDADYVVKPKIKKTGTQKCCKFYETWCSMIARCYATVVHKKYPSYIGCSVCEDWLTFGNFKLWMESQNWEGKELDKDLMVKGNKIYSPETCVFIGQDVNSFLKTSRCKKEENLYGVSFRDEKRKYYSQCGNPFSKKKEHLGYFTCPKQAHQAWKKRKHELACQLADLQTDQRVAQALRTRYL